MRTKYARTDILRQIRNMFLVFFGTVLFAFGTAVFILPFNLIVGGISGMSLIISSILPFEFLSIELIITIITWALFFMGLFVLGKDFALKTSISAIVYPVALSLFLKLYDPTVLGGFFALSHSPHYELSLFLAAAVGGVFVGTGCALTFVGGGSTGGVDIIAFSICKLSRRIKSSVMIFSIDAFIVVMGMFVTKDIVISLLGILSAFVTAIMIDKVFLGGTRAFVAHIITDKYDELTDAIINKLKRTTSILDAVGGYSGKEKKVLMVSFTMTQYADLMNAVKRIDKNAFITVYPAHEINGEGWTR